VPTNKRRGLNRAFWSMRRKPPTVPAAATAAFEASQGPRMLPGTYTVRMTKEGKTYDSPLAITSDPRSIHSAEERKAQYDLAVKLSDLLGDMAYTVDRMNSVRLGLDQRAAKLAANDPLIKDLKSWSASVDDLRKKIVATKEGGMITGEERLRENLTDLYGNVV